MKFKHNVSDFLNNFMKNKKYISIKKPIEEYIIPKKYILSKDGKITKVKNEENIPGKINESSEIIKPIH